MDITEYDFINGPFYDPLTTPIPPEDAQIGTYYRTYEVLSNTNCSVVLSGSDARTGEKKALKFIKLYKDTVSKVLNEINIQQSLSHKNFLKLDDCFSYDCYVCLVTRFMPHGSLYNYIQHFPNRRIPEDVAVIIMRQILQAVSYLHLNNIVHRDIKPENFLIADPNPERPRVVLSDYGFARILADNETCTDYLGTPEFTSPQIIAKVPYDKTTDLWSVGVTMFYMLSGNYPFSNPIAYPKRFKFAVVKGQLNYGLLRNFQISEDAIDLIKKLCNVSPNLRISAKNALFHPWISTNQKQFDHEFELGNNLFPADEYADEVAL